MQKETSTYKTVSHQKDIKVTVTDGIVVCQRCPHPKPWNQGMCYVYGQRDFVGVINFRILRWEGIIPDFPGGRMITTGAPRGKERQESQTGSMRKRGEGQGLEDVTLLAVNMEEEA